MRGRGARPAAGTRRAQRPRDLARGRGAVLDPGADPESDPAAQRGRRHLRRLGLRAQADAAPERHARRLVRHVRRGEHVPRLDARQERAHGVRPHRQRPRLLHLQPPADQRPADPALDLGRRRVVGRQGVPRAARAGAPVDRGRRGSRGRHPARRRRADPPPRPAAGRGDRQPHRDGRLLGSGDGEAGHDRGQRPRGHPPGRGRRGAADRRRRPPLDDDERPELDRCARPRHERPADAHARRRRPGWGVSGAGRTDGVRHRPPLARRLRAPRLRPPGDPRRPQVRLARGDASARPARPARADEHGRVAGGRAVSPARRGASRALQVSARRVRTQWTWPIDALLPSSSAPSYWFSVEWARR